jgi:hypothetical protein
MKHITKDWFVDVRFSLEERADHQWDLIILDKGDGRITGIGPLSWDDVVRECNRCQRLRNDFITELKQRSKKND